MDWPRAKPPVTGGDTSHARAPRTASSLKVRSKIGSYETNNPNESSTHTKTQTLSFRSLWRLRYTDTFPLSDSQTLVLVHRQLLYTQALRTPAIEWQEHAACASAMYYCVSNKAYSVSDKTCEAQCQRHTVKKCCHLHPLCHLESRERWNQTC